MFLGHFAVGMAAKRAAPKASLATLFLAAQWADTIWPALLLTGNEHVRIDPGNTAVTPLDFYDYPISHSLVGMVGWGLAFAAVYFAIRRQAREAIVLALCVVSHWVLDWISHKPDMPVAFSGTKVGLGLWASKPLTIVVELLLFAIGLAIYSRCTRPKDGAGNWGFYGMAGFLVIAYLANAFGTPPPSWQMVAYVGLAGAVVVVLWAWWVDKHREPAAT